MSTSVEVQLTDADVDGAELNEPLERATVCALRRWLTCHGVNFAANTRKPELIER